MKAIQLTISIFLIFISGCSNIERVDVETSIITQTLQSCSRLGQLIGCPAGYECYDSVSGGLAPPESQPVERQRVGGDQKCHKVCQTNNDCPIETPDCINVRRTTEDYVESLLLCTST